MLGAIIGDVVGSIYEFNNIKTKDFPLFGEKCKFTDDTVMSIAVSEALLQGGTRKNYTEALKKYAKLYPHAGYGLKFRRWAFSHDKRPYGSYGNGSAMRVSACGWAFDTLKETEAAAVQSAAVTHDDEEGLAGARATAAAIFMARTGSSKDEIKAYIEAECSYNLSRTLDGIRPTYKFNETCMGTVPEAIIAFLESENFEDAIRNAISLGGDSDTLAAITGSIAEAAYGIPQDIVERALGYLDEPLLNAYHTWNRHISKQLEKAKRARGPKCIENPRSVAIDLHFTDEQFERMKRGLNPQVMEDKWRIYFEDDELHFCRSWTGDEVYRVPVVKTESGCSIKSFLFEDLHPEKEEDFEFERKNVAFLILHGLLGESADSGFNLSDERDALAAWAWFGRMMY